MSHGHSIEKRELCIIKILTLKMEGSFVVARNLITDDIVSVHNLIKGTIDEVLVVEGVIGVNRISYTTIATDNQYNEMRDKHPDVFI